MSTMLHKALNKFITRTKGNQYTIDEKIPIAYLLSLVLSRITMLIRGWTKRIDHAGMFFVD